MSYQRYPVQKAGQKRNTWSSLLMYEIWLWSDETFQITGDNIYRLLNFVLKRAHIFFMKYIILCWCSSWHRYIVLMRLNCYDLVNCHQDFSSFATVSSAYLSFVFYYQPWRQPLNTSKDSTLFVQDKRGHKDVWDQLIVCLPSLLQTVVFNTCLFHLLKISNTLHLICIMTCNRLKQDYECLSKMSKVLRMVTRFSGGQILFACPVSFIL